MKTQEKLKVIDKVISTTNWICRLFNEEGIAFDDDTIYIDFIPFNFAKYIQVEHTKDYSIIWKLRDDVVSLIWNDIQEQVGEDSIIDDIMEKQNELAKNKAKNKGVKN